MSAQMDLGQLPGQHPVHFLGEGIIAFACSQPGFDVSERNPVVIASEGRAEDRARVSLGENQPRPFLLERVRKSRRTAQSGRRVVDRHA